MSKSCQIEFDILEVVPRQTLPNIGRLGSNHCERRGPDRLSHSQETKQQFSYCIDIQEEVRK